MRCIDPVTGGVQSSWNGDVPTGTVWEKSNDPSPAGWRVPTADEIEKLCDTNKVTNVWTTQNGVTGRKFTDKATGVSIFLPAVGSRDPNYGTLLNVGSGGFYWSSTQLDIGRAYHLNFCVDGVSGCDASLWRQMRGFGSSVRPVAAN